MRHLIGLHRFANENLLCGFPVSKSQYVQRIQVKRLTVSVVAFVVTVDLIALRGKMTNVARQE